jgi:hypothetical protein
MATICWDICASCASIAESRAATSDPLNDPNTFVMGTLTEITAGVPLNICANDILLTVK